MSTCKHCKRCKDGCDFCSCCGRCQRCDNVRPAINPMPYVPIPYPVYPEPYRWEVRPWWEGPTCAGATIITNPLDVTLTDGTNTNQLAERIGTVFAAHLGGIS